MGEKYRHGSYEKTFSVGAGAGIVLYWSMGYRRGKCPYAKVD
tara:strand:+ start:375 stop:500 length:126 start_codon:yes stop_codon:yes gene_type:complete